MNDSSKMVGENGGKLVADTAVHEDCYYMIEVQEDTVISVLEEKQVSTDTGVDVIGATEWNISGAILTKGTILTPRREFFSKIQLASGSVILRRL